MEDMPQDTHTHQLPCFILNMSSLLVHTCSGAPTAWATVSHNVRMQVAVGFSRPDLCCQVIPLLPCSRLSLKAVTLSTMSGEGAGCSRNQAVGRL